MMKDYTELKRLCKQVGCFCPEEHIVRVAIANTPLWLRLYFEKINQEAAKGGLGQESKAGLAARTSAKLQDKPPRKSLREDGWCEICGAGAIESGMYRCDKHKDKGLESQMDILKREWRAE